MCINGFLENMTIKGLAISERDQSLQSAMDHAQCINSIVEHCDKCLCRICVLYILDMVRAPVYTDVQFTEKSIKTHEKKEEDGV